MLTHKGNYIQLIVLENEGQTMMHSNNNNKHNNTVVIIQIYIVPVKGLTRASV